MVKVNENDLVKSFPRRKTILIFIVIGIPVMIVFNIIGTKCEEEAWRKLYKEFYTTDINERIDLIGIAHKWAMFRLKNNKTKFVFCLIQVR